MTSASVCLGCKCKCDDQCLGCKMLKCVFQPLRAATDTRTPRAVCPSRPPQGKQQTHTGTHEQGHPRAHMHTHKHTHARTHSLTYSLIRACTHARTHAHTHSLTHPLTDQLIHSLTHSLTHARTHSLTHARMALRISPSRCLFLRLPYSPSIVLPLSLLLGLVCFLTLLERCRACPCNPFPQLTSTHLLHFISSGCSKA